MPPRAPRAAVLASVLLLSLSAVSLAGDLPIKGAAKSRQSPRDTEDALLRSDLSDLRGMFTRTGLWVIVAESRQSWDRDVAPGLDEALSTSPEALARFARGLPESVRVLGPDIAGARVAFDLPDRRGKGGLGLYMPELIRQGRADATLLNSRVPNQGRFLTGLDVKREKDGDGERLIALYAPSLPRPLDGGRAPSTRPRVLPGEGRGDLALWAGLSASGSDGDDNRDAFAGWIGRDDLPTQPMRSFPGGEEDLSRALRSMRVPSQIITTDEGWYRALSLRPDSWELERTRVKHPTRFVSGAAPVTAIVDDGAGKQQARELIVGFVALYSRLLLTPEEAPLAAGVEGKAFYEAVHRGELPFLRDRDDVWLLRADVLRWTEKEARTRPGKARPYRDAVEMVRAWGDRYRLRVAEKIARGPLPFRYEPIGKDELEEMVDRRRVARGRVFSDDLAAWAKHHDPDFDKGDLPAAYALTAPMPGVSIQASLRAAAGPAAVASREKLPREPQGATQLTPTGPVDADDDPVAEANPQSPGKGGSSRRRTSGTAAPTRTAQVTSTSRSIWTTAAGRTTTAAGPRPRRPTGSRVVGWAARWEGAAAGPRACWGSTSGTCTPARASAGWGELPKRVSRCGSPAWAKATPGACGSSGT
jgi:hypothetical protein